MDKSLDLLLHKYRNKTGIKKTFCPYRICPIGAHSDHQYGKITGIAIDKGITVNYSPVENGVCELTSKNFSGEAVFHVNEVSKVKQGDWADHLRGATIQLGIKYLLRYGIKATIEGALPIGGLSSSAAVIIAYLSALCKANDIHLTESEIIHMAMAAENKYVGVACGKLDQSCEIYCKKNQLLYLDTKDDSYELLPQNPKMKSYEIAIFFSGIERTLAGSKFNLRVDECKAAAYALMAYFGMEYGNFEEARLRNVPREVFEQYKDRLPDNWRKRAEHFYTEFERVEKGVKAWKKGDIEEFGQLSFESGRSSIYNYETGSPELKTLYEIMLQTDGIYGGRFSGAGFKGCCVALIDPSFEDSIIEKVAINYLKVFPLLTGKYSAHICHSADGVKF